LDVAGEEEKQRFTPMVIETSVGMDRTVLALLCDAFAEEDLEGGDSRIVLRLHPALAPVKVAVLPLSKKLAEPAHELEARLRRDFNVFYDQSGNIGRRYRRQDEVGTPYCVTYDFESIDDGKVTVRDRDSMEQQRIAIDQVAAHVRERLDCAD
jgi:glycyl-tRNA synthetase